MDCCGADVDGTCYDDDDVSGHHYVITLSALAYHSDEGDSGQVVYGVCFRKACIKRKRERKREREPRINKQMENSFSFYISSQISTTLEIHVYGKWIAFSFSVPELKLQLIYGTISNHLFDIFLYWCRV